ncbi:F-box domain-containing protein [Caenorhabditis elegans]|uniref:F-box domain-containing protein n=1 Tax=Caenorhabditis elegans TaxID=6239 RepID=Q21842_CAEEL|nr:F-box domain-containing protein [Caenorhabditis elegans]CCD73090.2 F-box domain-containing protein [Caenorhabditis elegans]|eukprot:NP_500565.3 F-box B protein [Caenorhabditis elegans]
MHVFPLPNLPEKSSNYVLRRMPLTQLIGFALISKRTKDQAERLNVKMKSVDVWIDEAIKIFIWADSDERIPSVFVKFLVSQAPNDPGKREFTLRTREGKTWPKFGARQFLDHALEVCNEVCIIRITLLCDKIDCDGNKICDMFDGLTIESLSVCFEHLQLVNPFFQQMLTKFSRQSKMVSWMGNPFPHDDSHRIQIILCQFIHSVHLPAKLFSNVRVLLDGLLIADAVLLWNMDKMCLKDVNIFLKHWIHGSNTKLESASLRLDAQVMEMRMFSKCYSKMWNTRWHLRSGNLCILGQMDQKNTLEAK